jgi:tetratricopeptide (TPR) repeat protein
MYPLRRWGGSPFKVRSGPGLAVVGLAILLLSASLGWAQAAGAGSDTEREQRQLAAKASALDVAQQALNAGNYSQAIELLDLVVTGWPQDAAGQALMTRAKGLSAADQALNVGDYDKAAAEAQKVLAATPGDRKAKELLLRARLRQGTATLPAPTAAEPVAVTAPVAAPAQPAAQAPAPDAAATAEPIIPVQVKARNHEVSLSIDYMLGQGDVTMPFGFALSKLDVYSSIVPTVAEPERSSSYYGATLSYGYKRAWYLDLGFSHGDSSGKTDVDLGGSQNLPSEFSIQDDWMQGYLRYTFPSLRFTPVSAYLRVGASYVTAQLQDSTVVPGLGLYEQQDDTTDILGNVGAGIGYAFYTGQRWRVGLQLEVEGFYGTRSQDITEDLPAAELGFKPTTSLDNTLYGGIGRATVRTQYGFGKSGLMKAFLDIGFQGKFTMVEYSDQGNFKGDTFGELLWGPYVKLGLRYSF